ncbi:hypothetical protein [Azospirillum formosense]|uniref:hypothetical protein n=1 Tax=Azospirillum formosense TaxID=861533 RepID=UPI0031B85F82
MADDLDGIQAGHPGQRFRHLAERLLLGVEQDDLGVGGDVLEQRLVIEHGGVDEHHRPDRSLDLGEPRRNRRRFGEWRSRGGRGRRRSRNGRLLDGPIDQLVRVGGLAGTLVPRQGLIGLLMDLGGRDGARRVEHEARFKSHREHR